MSVFESTIKDLSGIMGFDIEVSPNESCSFEFGDLIITLQYRQAQDDIAIFSVVTDPEKILTLSEKMLRAALSLSYNGTGTGMNYLGLLNENLVLTNYIPIEGLSSEDLLQRIYIFSQSAQSVHDSLIAMTNQNIKESSSESSEQNTSDTMGLMSV
ncbi:type III secretion system chaperone [Succinivibrio sp.]|uniref:type III secretion system chaperone n=1 Tax=Succinivibrio sp. TaxID=2053619 RepID=UPI0025D1DF36|nr:type III secretion system chaperone [Succinivibrio sp.]MBQ9220954.1 type III secretion system chaperone [Succinivibrio sp.]